MKRYTSPLLLFTTITLFCGDDVRRVQINKQEKAQVGDAQDNLFDENDADNIEADEAEIIETAENDQDREEGDVGVIVPQEVPVIGYKDAKIEKKPLAFENGDSILEFYNKLRIDAFFGRNLRLLNNCNPTDKIAIPGRHTWDASMIYRYGFASHCYDVLKIKATLRNKYTWGDELANASTSFSSVKINDLVTGDHSHAIPLNFPIIRELWMEIVLNDLIHSQLDNRHYVTMGLFPFQLGRGIALGDAYATAPDLLGYNPAFAVQQYAPGVKLGGDLLSNSRLIYDLYYAILDNKADTFDNVNAKTRGQQCGHRFCQARGFGVINFILAAHLIWKPFNEPCKKLSVEPYALFDEERTQKIEFLDDATSKLGTFGLALEFEYGNWEGGFDSAANVGHQKVRCWDRNAITSEFRTGILTAVNDKVIAIANNPPTNDIAGKKAVFTSANQAIIDTSVQEPSQNGLQIGDSNLKNDINRFRPCYVNTYKGAMAVADFAYKFTPDFKLAAGGGWASGDEAPNKDLADVNDSRVDGDYKGFISLQEIYAGTRIRSAYLLAGSGKIPRVLSFPSPLLPGDAFPATVSRFTNLRFLGSAIWWNAYGYNNHKWLVNPNVIAYWQDHKTKLFDRAIEATSPTKYASRFLGVELNMYLETMLLQDLKFFAVGAVFVPGGHYRDIKGKPLNKDQQKFLDNLDVTGINVDRVPVLGDNASYFVNFGLEYKF